MILWQLLLNNPMAGIALLMTIVTLGWCLTSLRVQHNRLDRYLMALLGLIAAYLGLAILRNAGLWQYPGRGLGGALDTTIAAVCLLAVMILRFVTADRHNTKVALRVVEAAQPAPRPSKPLSMATERSVLAVFGIDVHGDINMWHNTAESFFGWRRDEVIGTHRPFIDRPLPETKDSQTAGIPRVLRLTTQNQAELKALVWQMPVPGEPNSLILVLETEESRQFDSIVSHAHAPALRAQVSAPA